jgi:hypothetical protein
MFCKTDGITDVYEENEIAVTLNFKSFDYSLTLITTDVCKNGQ